MKSVEVYRNGKFVGLLTRYHQKSYVFEYDDSWFNQTSTPAISLTLPKSKQKHESDHLFPFFFNLLSEGVNLNLQSRHLKIDEEDYFELLVATAQTDTIGAVTLKPRV